MSKTLFPQWDAQSLLDLLHAWEQDMGKAKIHIAHNWESRHSIFNVSGQSGTGDKATGSGRSRIVQSHCFIYLKQVKVKPWRAGLLYLMKLKPSAFKYFEKHKLVSKIGLRFVTWEIGLSCETVGTPCQKDDENKLANSDSWQQFHWL